MPLDPQAQKLLDALKELPPVETLTVLEARGIAVAEEQRARILGCDDLERLELWVRRAATVADASELFEA